MTRPLIALIAASLAAAAPAQTPRPQPTLPTTPVITPEAITAINDRFEAYRQSAHVPGLVWGIVQGGRLVHVGTLGVQDPATNRPVTPDTVFRIASMSKAFTALAIFRLRDEGRLSLDALAETYVPELKGLTYPTTDSPRIRVRDLLGHVAGFVTDDPWGDRQQVLPEAAFTALIKAGVPFTRAPETAYEYSNLGYALLGRIVTNVSGRPFEDYIESEIMRPLGMAASGYEIGDVPVDKLAVGYRWENDAYAREPSMPRGAFGAMGGVHTSAGDYAKWAAFLLSAWPPRDGPETGPAKRSTVRQFAIGASLPRLGQRNRPGNPTPCPTATVYSGGFNVVRDCDLGFVLTHNGGYPGYGSTLILMPDTGVAIFAFANRTYAGPSGAAFDAAQILKDAGLLPERTLSASAPLAAAYGRAGAMYRAGNLTPGQDVLAMNFLMDRSADNWAREFARLKAAVGNCRADEPIVATGWLTGRFAWTCERGSIVGDLLLAPTNPPRIQAFRMQERPAAPAQ